MVGENGFHQGRIHSFKATHIRVESRVRLHPLYKTLNKEVHRHITVKIESLTMYIFLDSEEVCVKLENGLSMRMDLAIGSLASNYLIAYAFRIIPSRTIMASINQGYYIAFKVKSLL